METKILEIRDGPPGAYPGKRKNKKGDKQMKKVYRYEDEYGVLELDLEEIKVVTDELDREKIWKDAREDYREQQRIYAEIIEELFGEDVDTIFPPLNKNQFWGGKCTDFGFKAINDEIEIIVDAEGTFIYERTGVLNRPAGSRQSRQKIKERERLK